MGTKAINSPSLWYHYKHSKNPKDKHTHAHARTHTHARTNARTHTRPHTHAHTHTHIHTNAQPHLRQYVGWNLGESHFFLNWWITKKRENRESERFNISSLQSVILKTLSLVSILFSCLYLSLCSSAREVGKIAQNQPKIVIKLSINYNPFGLEISEIFYFRMIMDGRTLDFD